MRGAPNFAGAVFLAGFFSANGAANADIDTSFRQPFVKNVVVTEEVTPAEIRLLAGVRDATLTVKVKGSLVRDSLIETLNSEADLKKIILVSIGRLDKIHVNQLRRIKNMEVWVDLRVAPADGKTVKLLDILGPVRKKIIVPSGAADQAVETLSGLNNFDVDVDVRYAPPPGDAEAAAPFPKGVMKRIRVSADIGTDLLSSFFAVHQPDGVMVYATSVDMRTDLTNFFKANSVPVEVVVGRQATPEQVSRFSDLPQLRVTFDSAPQPLITPKFVETLDRMNPPLSQEGR